MTSGSGTSRTPLPAGFHASGINCGVRRYRPDVGLITSKSPAVAAGVFTQNTCLGAHIPYCQSLLPSENIQALITNSGQANTATGTKGIEDNLAMAKAVSTAMSIDVSQVLTASTGVIGEPMQIEKILAAVPTLVEDQVNTAENFATAILTTDLVPKTVSTKLSLSAGEITLTGIAKGSGMIHPNMATMLAYFLTDLKLTPDMAQTTLTQAVEPSFNMISVDGEPSTNDSVYLLANGVSGVEIITDEDHAKWRNALTDLGQVLAKSIVKDGEGATKMIEVQLTGAPDETSAKTWARSLTISPLIKTAVNGRDPNWGRIIGRLGAEGVPSEILQKLSLSVQDDVLFDEGQPQNGDLEALREKLKTDEVKIQIDMKSGSAEAVAWGCDLSKKYVEINAEYTT